MDDREEERDRGLALGNFGTQLLLQALQRCISTITAVKCSPWHRLCRLIYRAAFYGEEIEG